MIKFDFTKLIYNACHNSFIILEHDEMINYYSEFAKLSCSGKETDGLILAKQPIDDSYDIEMIIYNKDGSLAPMCGNGIRCLVLFALDRKLIKEKEIIKVKTASGIREVKLLSTNPYSVCVNMGSYTYDKDVLSLKHEVKNEIALINGMKLTMNAVFLTTHHLVCLVDEIDESVIDSVAKTIYDDENYLKKININFVKIIDRENIFVKTFERGVGWTLACGSGASSSVAVLHENGLVNDKVKVHFVDGELDIMINEKNEVLMQGSAELGK